MSLGWASANMDATVFECPGEVRLDRKPTPHLSFGFGAHLCLGAPHARLLVRTLLQNCVEHVGKINVLQSKRHIEHAESYERAIGFESLVVRMTRLPQKASFDQ